MGMIHATEGNFHDVISEGVVLVDFWAEWCGPCKMIAPIIDEIANQYEGRVKVVKVDIEQARELVDRLGIMSIPTIYLYVDGEKKEESIGFVSKEALVELIGKY